MSSVIYHLTSFGLILTSIKLWHVNGFDLEGYINVALNKPTKQIHTGFNGSSDLANDGNTGGNYFLDKTCTHTVRTGNVWWMIDLLTTYQIQYIRMYNRIDSNDWFLANFSVHVSLNNPLKDPQFPDYLPGKLCFNHTDQVPQSGPANITCLVSIKGRYVYIWKTEDFLTLCEVEILVKAPHMKELFLQISEGQRNDETPFMIATSTLDSTRCLVNCLSFQHALTTVVQFHKPTSRCECIQYSFLVSDDINTTLDDEWTMYSLMNN